MSDRILIVGGPKTGKTTYSEQLARELAAGVDPSGLPSTAVKLMHTDSLIGVKDWSEASAEVALWLDERGPWIIEGVAVPRALRKWLAAHPEGRPADRVIFMTRPFVSLTKGQETMAKGVATVWAEVVDQLASRGVSIMFHP